MLPIVPFIKAFAPSFVKAIVEKSALPDKTKKVIYAASDAIVADPAALQKIEREIPPEEVELLKGQQAINMQDAKSKNKWQAGWRPAIGWAIATSIFLFFAVFPTITFSISIFTGAPPPTLPMEKLLAIALPLLGIGTLRTIEKLKNAD